MKGGGLYSIVMIVVLFGLMYFMMIRPQKKQQQQWQNMINNLKKGDHVVTRGGLHGVIDSIDKANKTVTLDCDGIFLTFSLNAIGNVQSAPAAQPAAKEEKAAEPAKEEKADSQAEDKETK